MRAIVQRRYGGPEQLELTEVDPPRPGSGEVLVRVRAAAVDRGTWHTMTGLPLIARAFLGVRRPRTPVLGRDAAGVVEEVGEGVTGVSVGDAVLGTADGSLAELAVIPLVRLAPRPTSLSFEQAAALPVSGVTALQAVRAARVADGDRVLVLGASGGVGTFAVQLAVARGGEVTAVCSATKAELVSSLGAARVLDYRIDRLDPASGRYDAIVDIAGNRSLRSLRALLTGTGRLVIVGGEGGGRWLGGMHRPIGAALLSTFSRQDLVMLVARERADDLMELTRLVDSGAVVPALDRIYAFQDAATALSDLASGTVRGKAVVAVTPA